MKKRAKQSSVSAEFSGVALGDARLDRRLGAIVTQVARAPDESFPTLLRTESEREALYRFFGNDAVEWADIMQPHVAATLQRCRGQSVIRIAHDTTAFSFEGDREGLGPLTGKKQGFFAHTALAISAGEQRAPLGVLGLIPFVREKKAAKKPRSAQTLDLRATARENKESQKWSDLSRDVDSMFDANTARIHVMDREADDYALFAELVNRGTQFVIRGDAGRRLNRGLEGNVEEKLDEASVELFRTVTLAARPKPTPNYKARGERRATLHVRASAINLRKPQHAQSETEELELNVVQVFEPDPPVDEEPVSWTLYTTEPITTADELAAIVDHYRCRWRIEEFFKALKTGCAFEKRQLTTFDGLLRALAMFLPIAWHLMLLRTLGRSESSTPASVMFDSVQLDVLRDLTAEFVLPPNPTMRDAMLAIADFGGHIRRNGDPGWIVLGRGFEDFLKAERVWRAALAYAAKM